MPGLVVPHAARPRGARFGPFEADLETRELRKHGIRIKITGQVFQVLELLIQHSGHVVRREDLRDAVWPGQSWGEHDYRLNKLINKVRDSLCDSADTPRFIETIPKVGYRFLVPVDWFGESGAGEAVSTTPPARAVSPTGKFWTWTRIRLAVVAAVLSLAIIAVAVAGLRRSTPVFRFAEPVPLTTYIGSESQPSLSPDGSQVVYAWDGGERGSTHLYISSVSGGDGRRVTADAAGEVGPVWSPSGDRIAFLRESGPGRAEVWLVRADGTEPRKVRDGIAADQTLSWTKDQSALIVAQRSDNGVPALFRVSTSDGSQRQITYPAFPKHSGGDLSPAVSPDGRTLAFTRSTSPAWRDVFVVPLSPEGTPAQDPERITDARSLIDHLVWMPDGASIVYSATSSAAGARHLFRIDGVLRRGARTVTNLAIEGEHPTASGFPVRLAFVRKNIEQSSIWQLELDRPNARPRSRQLITSTRRDYTSDLSPDGTQIVFSSVRSGSTEVWISQTDGSRLRRLTSSGGLAPRWSPDGKQIAYESSARGQPDVYTLNLATGAVLRLTSEGPFNARPSWSRDGRFIYFCSNRSGRPQIWKVPSEGGDPVQITRHGGQYAVEGFDRKTIYFTSPDRPSQVWATTVNGGDESLILHNTAGFACIAASPDGLYFLSDLVATGARLNFYKFADRSVLTLANLDRPVHQFLSSSHDGRSVLYTQVDRQDSDLMLLSPAH